MISFLSVLLLAAPVQLVPSHQAVSAPSAAATLEWLLPATPANHTFVELPILRSTYIR